MRSSSPKRLGISGQIAAGKTLFLSELRRAGWQTLSADEMVHEVYREHRWDVEQLRAKASRSPRALKALEDFVHPRVREKIKDALQKKKGRLAIEIPLLFEKGWASSFEECVLIYAPRELRRQRALKRGMSKALFERLEQKQWSLFRKSKDADLLISNSDSRESFQKRTRDLIRLWK